MIKILRKKIKSSFYYELVTNYFSKFKKSYAESFGEDLFVNYFFQKKKKGLYVDVGCNLPKSRSLTYQLYRKNWNGIKIDISPRSIKLNNFIRPKDKNLNLSIGDKEKEVESFIFYHNCSMNTVDKNFKKFTEKSVNKKPSVFRIKQLKLDTVLKKNNVNKIDYLNIDVEGNEDQVLSGFSIKNYKPDLVSIEIHDKECPPIKNKLYKYFVRNNYYLVSIYGWTYFFSRKKSSLIHFNT